MRANGTRKLTLADAMEINQPVMAALARTHIFAEELERDHEFNAIESRHIGVVRAILVSTLCDIQTTARETIGRVQLQNGVSQTLAREHLYEAESVGLVQMKLDDSDRRKNWWMLRPGIAEKLHAHGLACLDVANVVRAQIGEPMNKNAGRDLIDPRFYFNIIDPEMQEAARRALVEVLARSPNTTEDKK